MTVELLFMAWNRLDYTRTSMELLKANTDWRKVSRLVVYDDGSEDGTREYLDRAREDIPVPGYEVRFGGWGSTGATMNDFVALTEADAFVKLDNDICVPPGWLEPLLHVAHKNPTYDLIGMEAGWCGAYQGMLRHSEYGVQKASHIGGVGFMRTNAFIRRRPIPLSLGKNGRAGFTIWQHRYHVKSAWIAPDLPVVQLDRIPEEPWRSLAATYIEKGWAREWPPYEADMKEWWSWIPSQYPLPA